MKAIIIEDEVLAAKRLEKMLKEADSTIKIVAKLDTIRATVQWLEKNTVDAAFFDIHLADGLSFEIFEQVQVTCSVIFTTAYDQYAIKAFEVNGVDYLLKPIKTADLQRALGKIPAQQANTPVISQQWIDSLIRSQQEYKKQFVIKVGEHIKMIKTNDIAAFMSEDKANYLIKQDGTRVLIDYSLDQINDLIDPNQFYRINRKYIVNMDSIKDLVAFSGSRLKLTLHHCESNDLLVARERVRDFKQWLEG